MLKEIKRCFEYNGSVNREGIQIFGTVTVEELSNLLFFSIANQQLDIKETIFIPETKPDVETIQSMRVKACIIRAWTANRGQKFFIEGVLKQKIMYTACDAKQSVHTVESETPFSHFIDVSPATFPPGIDPTNFTILIPEDAFIQRISGRELFKNVLLIASANQFPL